MRRLFLVRINKKRIIIEIISFLFILLWVYVSTSKFSQLQNFKIQLRDFPFIGNYSEILYWIIPSIESLIALLFFFSVTRMAALYLSSILLLLLTAYILALLYIADSIPCSCTGIIPSLSWTQHLFFNIGWIVIALFGIVCCKKIKPNRKYY